MVAVFQISYPVGFIPDSVIRLRYTRKSWQDIKAIFREEGRSVYYWLCSGGLPYNGLQ